MQTTMLKSSDLIMALLCLSTGIAEQNAGNILGTWFDAKDSSRKIEFYRENNGEYSGKVLDDNSKRLKAGHLLFKALVYDPELHCFKGQMAPPNAGFTVPVTITFSNENQLEIVGKKWLMSKVFHFNRSI